MKRFRELIEERLNEGSYGYPADDMTMKEVKVACYAAQKILDMMEDGATVQRWQISAIVKAAEELTSVYTSMSADQDEYEDEWDDEEEPMYVGFEYPSMYESVKQGSKEHLDKLKTMLDKARPGSTDHSQIRSAISSMFGDEHIPEKHRNIKPSMYESTELDEISMEKIQKVRDRAADRVALSVGRTEKDPKTGNRKWIPPTEDEKALAKKGMKTFAATSRAITRSINAKKRNEEIEEATVADLANYGLGTAAGMAVSAAGAIPYGKSKRSAFGRLAARSASKSDLKSEIQKLEANLKKLEAKYESIRSKADTHQNSMERGGLKAEIDFTKNEIDKLNAQLKGVPSVLKSLSWNEEVENLDEASTKVEIPKSRYETILKIHGPKTVARTPKGDMQYRGAREERHNKTTDTSITQTYSHPDHGVATIEKHTHNPTGKVTYYMYKKSKMNEEVELDEAKIERGKNTVGAHHLERDSGEHKMYTAYTGSLVRRLHTVTDKDDNILGQGSSAASAMAKAKLKKPHRDALMHDDNQIIKVHDTRSTQNVGTQVATPGKGKWFKDHDEAIKYAKSLPGKIRLADPKTGHVD